MAGARWRASGLGGRVASASARGRGEKREAAASSGASCVLATWPRPLQQLLEIPLGEEGLLNALLSRPLSPTQPCSRSAPSEAAARQFLSRKINKRASGRGAGPTGANKSPRRATASFSPWVAAPPGASRRQATLSTPRAPAPVSPPCSLRPKRPAFRSPQGGKKSRELRRREGKKSERFFLALLLPQGHERRACDRGKSGVPEPPRLLMPLRLAALRAFRRRAAGTPLRSILA